MRNPLASRLGMKKVAPLYQTYWFNITSQPAVHHYCSSLPTFQLPTPQPPIPEVLHQSDAKLFSNQWSWGESRECEIFKERGIKKEGYLQQLK